jgi:hypothetical protein
MGYYSKFSLRVDPPELRDEVDRELTKFAYGGDTVSVFDTEQWNGGDGPKWYKHDANCRELSSKMPGVTIEVERLGEDYDERSATTCRSSDERPVTC